MRILVGFLLWTSMLYGVELSLETIYNGPEKLTVSNLGISMGLPRHWQAVAKEGKGLKLFQKDSNDTMLLRAKELSAAEVASYLNVPHYIGNNIKIFPQKRIVTLNSRIYRRAYAFNGSYSKQGILLYLILGPQNRVVLMHVLYDKAHDSSIKASSMNVVQTMNFTPTKQLQSLLQGMEIRLKGIHISYLRRDAGYDNKRELWLCSNKRYLLKDERTVAGNMSRITEQKFGKWSYENQHLILQGDDGFEHFIRVKAQDRVLFFDGVRSYELKNHQCQ